MIPKILHYCWFGGNEMPKTEKRCLKSWEKHLSDFEWRLWSEDNFDVRCNKYVSEAYDAKKYMYVSDYCRLKALYDDGGLYLDTDCKVKKDFSPLLNQKGFTGFGGDNREIAAHTIAVEPHHPLIKECLDSYADQSFYRPNGEMDTTSINIRMMGIFARHGFIPDGNQQEVEGITIYPMTYFCPVGFLPEELPDVFTKDTYCDHIWSDKRLRLERNLIYKFLHKYWKKIRH